MIINFEFFSEDDHAIQKISSMPGVCRFGIYELRKHLEPLVAKGLSSILLFGVPESASKVKTKLHFLMCSVALNM